MQCSRTPPTTTTAATPLRHGRRHHHHRPPGEVRQGQHKYGAGGDGSSASSSSASSSSSSASPAQPPDFEKIVGDLYRERAGEQTADAHEQFLSGGEKCNDIRKTLEMEDAGGDDEIEQVRTENDLKQEVFCPIMQAIMTEPMTCKECNHSFESSAILQVSWSTPPHHFRRGHPIPPPPGQTRLPQARKSASLVPRGCPVSSAHRPTKNMLRPRRCSRTRTRVSLAPWRVAA